QKWPMKAGARCGTSLARGPGWTRRNSTNCSTQKIKHKIIRSSPYLVSGLNTLECAFVKNRLIEKKLRILMVEDEARDATLVEHILREGGFAFSFRRVDNEEGFLNELEQFQPSVILSDHGLPTFDGFTALSLAQKNAPDVPFIFVTGSLGDEMTIKALKS